MSDPVTDSDVKTLVADASALLNRLVDERDTLESEVEELKDKITGLSEELDGHNSDSEQALIAVRDWMLDVLYLNKPMSDPRKILRIVERALEE